MSVQLSIFEKVVGRTDRHSFTLRLASARLPARDVLAQHVRVEVRRLNDEAGRNASEHDRVASFFVGVHSHPTEQRLNPKQGRLPKMLDSEAEIAAACDGVAAKQVIMLFDDREVTDLDAPLTVTEGSVVTFLRLMPLVGG